ncbi:MAG: hypothetical protein ABIL58_11415 [Pseudomonadota bacterium]
MGFLRALVIGAAAVSTIYASAATFAKWGIPSAAFPQGVRLRQESLIGRRGAMVLPMRAGRTHRGGGLSGGK